MMWVLMAVAAVIAAVLVLPLRLRAGLAGDGRTRWFAEAALLGGLVRVGRDGDGGYWACGGWRRVLAPRAAKQAAAASPAERGRSLTEKWRRFDAGERRALARLLGKLWGAVELSAQGRLRYGFEDPAVTAWLHAFLCAVRGTGALAGLEAEADFAAAGWSGRVAAVLTVRPYALLGPAAGCLLTIMTRRIRKKWTGGRSKWLVQT
jgi:hypothetical protein